MKGHGHVKAAVLAHLETWVPIRLELIRQMEHVDGLQDPVSYLAADNLPQNDPSQYPCVIAMSTSTAGMRRRAATSTGEPAVFDVDYDLTVVVAVESNGFGDDVTVAAHRDWILLAVRDCLVLPGRLDDLTEILQTPTPAEDTGAAVQTVRGNPLAAGTVTFRVRCTETLLPTAVLAAIVGGDVTVTAVDADDPLPE